MLANEFLDVVRKAMPPRKELRQFGLDDSEIEGIQQTFMHTRRTGRNVLDAQSEIEKMIMANDCSNLEVGLMRFLPEPRAHPHGVIIAFCEADPVVVRKDGTIAMYDHARADMEPKECALDSERFLDALAKFVEIRRRKTEWRGRVSEAAKLCASLAGGSASQELFVSLCSFLN